MNKYSADNYFQCKFLNEHLSGHKGFACGGCFKNIFNGEKIKDIDIFFRSKEDFNEAVDYFNTEDKVYTFNYRNDNVVSFKHKNGIVLELCCKIFGEPEDILNQFDFTITKFAYYKELVKEDDGNSHYETFVCFNDKFFEHLHMKRLVLDDKVLYPMSTLERMFRYIKYGYMPCKETKLKIAKEIHNMNIIDIEVSESLYNGMD